MITYLIICPWCGKESDRELTEEMPVCTKCSEEFYKAITDDLENITYGYL